MSLNHSCLAYASQAQVCGAGPCYMASEPITLTWQPLSWPTIGQSVSKHVRGETIMTLSLRYGTAPEQFSSNLHHLNLGLKQRVTRRTFYNLIVLYQLKSDRN
jgi:hypothetical protein